MIILWAVQAHDGPAHGAQMVVDLEHQATVATSPLGGARPVGTAPALRRAAIEDHLHVPVVPEPIHQIFVEARLVAGNKKEMSGHMSRSYPSDLCGGSRFLH